MSSFVTNKFVSHLDQRDFDLAIGKLSYEIKHRKKEFLSLCTKNDPNLKSRVEISTFAKILDEFTVYPENYEKRLIINKTAINDKYIDYLNLAENLRINEEPHQDIFLQHLNDERFKKYNQQKNILPSSETDRRKEEKQKEKKLSPIIEEKNKNEDDKSDISNDFGLLPIEITNAEINEENFLRKISKDLMVYFLTHTKGERPKEFIHKLFKQCDFDDDDKYTIGEFNNFLLACGKMLNDADLRFFYENFPVINGRVSINQINNFIEVNSEKNYEEVNANEQILDENKINKMKETNILIKDIEQNLEKQKTYHKKIEDQKIIDNTKKNYITNTLKDCLLIFGRDYLMKYFSKYFFNFDGKPFIEDNSFLLGLCGFGYRMPMITELGEFQSVCIYNNIARARGLGHSLIIDVEGLFDFIIDFFEIEEVIKHRGSEELIRNIGSTFKDKINEALLGMITDIKGKNKNEENINKNEINLNANKDKNKLEEYFYKSIGEKDFKKRFINNFGFIDHNFFNSQIQTFCCEEVKVEKKFNPTLINVKKFIDLSYNFLFLYLIKSYKSLGIMLDSSSHKILSEIYLKIKEQIFPKQNAEKQNLNNKKEENSTNLFNTTNQNQADRKSVLINNEANKQNNIYFKSAPVLKEKIEYNFPSIQMEEQKIDPEGLNTYVLNKKILGTIKINDENKTITDKYKTIKPSTRIINSDPVEAIPLLYNTCVKYIINLFKLERVSFNLLKGIGICKIFRDHLKKLRGNKQKIHWMILIQNLESLVPEVVVNFLRKIALDNKDSDGNITLQFYFSKLEQILLQYNLSLEDDKNYAKYYV